MLRFVIRKMISKKWMILALLIGNILLIGITASNPMYTKAVLQRTLTRSLNEYLEERNAYPATVTLRSTNTSKYEDYIARKTYSEEIPEKFGIPAKQIVTCYSISSSRSESNLERDEARTAVPTLGTLSDMEDHIEIITGSGMSKAPDADGVYDVIVSENCLLRMDLIQGEILTYTKLFTSSGDNVKVRIAGVFRYNDAADPYWVATPSSYSNTLFMDWDLFNDWFLGEEFQVSVSCIWYNLLDYTQVRVDLVDQMLATIDEYTHSYKDTTSVHFTCTMSTMLTEFKQISNRVSTTLLVLQTPILLLVAAFIFMISRQMLDMEQSEISVIKSRGAAKRQIIMIYVLQSLIICGISVALGLPLSAFLVQVLGSANAFLEFVGRSALSPEIDTKVLEYILVASFFSMACMIIPVFKHSKVTIVMQKQKKNRNHNTPFWQKTFLDVIALGISIYGLRMFNGQKDMLAQMVLEGKAMDPLLYLSASLFMLGAGLFAIRVLPVLSWAIFSIFKKKWSPALYASFQQVLRTRRSQGFIMIFLVMTIALGVFDASAARTINEHNEQNLRYTVGADVVLQEVWEDNADTIEEGSNEEIVYVEPDFDRWTHLDGVESAARVLVNTGTVTLSGSGTVKDVRIMGINTKEFGNTAWFDPTLMPDHWYNYLNAIARKSNAVLVSSNFRDKYNYQLGEVIRFKGSRGSLLYGVIYGFVDYWPSYASSVYKKGSDGIFTQQSAYTIIANLSWLQDDWDVTPYQVWLKCRGGSDFVYRYIKDELIPVKSFTDISEKIVDLKNDPLIQGTNGVLTVGFIVVLILCAVGFLMYWILSIRQRELQFGIFRAMGMSMREIIVMLLNEQFFISITSILTGGLTGILTSRLFMPLIQIAYSSSDSTIPLRIISAQSDIVRLAIIIGLMIFACLLVLGMLIRSMKIAQALKLGED